MVQAQGPEGHDELSQKSFKPEDAEIARLLEMVMNAQVPKDEHLDSDMAVSPLDQYFICSVCLQVVEDPRECLQCNQLCCAPCITQWSQHERNCPNCREALNLNDKINRFVIQTLNSAEFRCDKCQAVLKYESRKEHWQTCGVSLQCNFLGCARAGHTFASVALLKEHWNFECNEILLKCSVCRTFSKRQSIPLHSCERGLLALVKGLESQVQKLQSEVKTLNQKNHVNNPDHEFGSCPEGHELKNFQKAFLREMEDGVLYHGRKVFCNWCKKQDIPVDSPPGYYRCTNVECDFDVCQQCAHETRDRLRASRHQPRAQQSQQNARQGQQRQQRPHQSASQQNLPMDDDSLACAVDEPIHHHNEPVRQNPPRQMSGQIGPIRVRGPAQRVNFSHQQPRNQMSAQGAGAQAAQPQQMVILKDPLGRQVGRPIPRAQFERIMKEKQAHEAAQRMAHQQHQRQHHHHHHHHPRQGHRPQQRPEGNYSQAAQQNQGQNQARGFNQNANINMSDHLN